MSELGTYTEAAEKYGAAYAIIRLEAASKRALIGKPLSASEYARTEKSIRALVRKHADGDTITAESVNTIIGKLSEDKRYYMDFPGTMPEGVYVCEKNCEEWVKYGRKGTQKTASAAPPAPSPAPAPAPPPTPQPTDADQLETPPAPPKPEPKPERKPRRVSIGFF